ncbi:FecR domain-containing protein [Maribacter sp. 4G9]|uniref:FecR domain-containing protein n=1 Tax=Maribacter sp. 4G9 TaxID=1889777 RepID=UPI0013FD95EB|nr:FecR domain-containing protein [Maribacter sp. 4G9]
MISKSIFKDVEVSQERYTGRFKTETIDEVLRAFQRIKEFEYSNDEDKIEINPKK